MKKIINQAPLVRYRSTVCEIFFSNFPKKTFSAESEIGVIPHKLNDPCKFPGSRFNSGYASSVAACPLNLDRLTVVALANDRSLISTRILSQNSLCHLDLCSTAPRLFGLPFISRLRTRTRRRIASFLVRSRFPQALGTPDSAKAVTR